MADYEVSRTAGQCCVSGHAFQEGEEFYSALFETPEGFERRDYSEQNWDGPPDGAFCHFKTQLPHKEKPQKTFVNDDVLVNFFRRLAEHDDRSKLRFRFVLSLILMRKRLLKYVGTIREGNKEYWEMKLMQDKSLHRVLNPVLSEVEIEALTSELGMILHGGTGLDLDGEGDDSDATVEAESPESTDVAASEGDDRARVSAGAKGDDGDSG